MTVREDDDHVRIDVVDAGPGIAEDDRSRAFTPFFRAPLTRSRGTPGHGVGLALVAKIATLHGGVASFEAPPVGASGAHLRVELPAWRPT